MAVYRIRLDSQRHAAFLAEQRRDPITHEPLRAGMEIVICAEEKFAFVADNWVDRCPLCGSSNSLLQIPPNNVPPQIGRVLGRHNSSHDPEVESANDSPHGSTWLRLLLLFGACIFAYFMFFRPDTPAPFVVQPTQSATSIPTPQIPENPLPTILTKIERFFEIKSEATRTLEGSAYYEVLAGVELQKRLKALDTLRSKNCYWDIAPEPSIRFESVTFVNPDYVQIQATIQENANLYCNPNPNPDPGSYHDPYRMQFDLERIDGIWYITNQKAID